MATRLLEVETVLNGIFVDILDRGIDESDVWGLVISDYSKNVRNNDAADFGRGIGK